MNKLTEIFPGDMITAFVERHETIMIVIATDEFKTLVGAFAPSCGFRYVYPSRLVSKRDAAQNQ